MFFRSLYLYPSVPPSLRGRANGAECLRKRRPEIACFSYDVVVKLDRTLYGVVHGVEEQAELTIDMLCGRPSLAEEWMIDVSIVVVGKADDESLLGFAGLLDIPVASQLEPVISLEGRGAYSQTFSAQTLMWVSRWCLSMCPPTMGR